MDYWDQITHHIGENYLEAFWAAHPLVRERINERISGDPSCWPIDWLRQRVEPMLPFENSLSVGCGTGALERDLVAKGITTSILGIDIADGPLEYARSEAAASGFDGAIDYSKVDAWSLLADRHTFDSIFFHGSLHHFERPGELLGLARQALKDDGILYMDEYVGPSMKDWNWRKLLQANMAYRLLPNHFKRSPRVDAPTNFDDPTESVCSAEILDGVNRHFEVLEQRDYGGHLLLLLFPHLVRPGESPGAPREEEFSRAVKQLLDWEEALLSHSIFTRSRSFHSVVLAQPKRM